MAQMTKTIRNCHECPAYRDAGADGAHCVINRMVFGTHPTDKSAPAWCPLRKMALLLQYKGS